MNPVAGTRPTTAQAQPLIGFGQVRHSRLRPAPNAFAYPTYFLMLPLRSLQQNGSTILAVNRRAALAFHDTDHGDGRSAEQGGALAWLDTLLLREGITDATGEVWLHCYPRVLGYAFKPVSFWYCHSADGSLRTIVVEVNNTFGERHCYLLDNPRYGVALTADKAFHVSPFCKVEGHYQFRFMRAHAASNGGAERTVARIDYYDGDNSAHGPLLLTSVSGTLEPVTRTSIRRALWRYPAMTLGVVFHIHWQAWKLWRKKSPFFAKPAAPDVFVSRQQTPPEATP